MTWGRHVKQHDIVTADNSQLLLLLLLLKDLLMVISLSGHYVQQRYVNRNERLRKALETCRSSLEERRAVYHVLTVLQMNGWEMSWSADAGTITGVT